MLRTFKDSATYNGIFTTIRVSTKLEELTLPEIQSKMVIEARDIDMESKLESGLGQFTHPLCHAVEKPINHQKRVGLGTQDRQVSLKQELQERSGQAQSASATMHQVDSVISKAEPEKWIVDSGASAHMTGIKSLLKDYKEVATTTVTVAKGVGIICFKTDHVDFTFIGVLHVLKGCYNTHDEVRKKAQALTEDLEEQTGKETALKKTKEVQPVLL